MGKPLRQKCWPMPKVEQDEMELQAEELVKAGLAEPFPPGEYPQACSPTFLVPKKDSKVNRMVIQYRKLNARCKPHAGFLPNMEAMVESLSKCRYKSKMDMRSGFWQVGVTPRARDLSAFCLPSGRILRPLCMMFGLQGAPGIFQELMEILASKAKQDEKTRQILSEGHLASFFDDTGVGCNDLDDHFYLLERYFQTCLDSQIRIKLSKCEFLQEEIEYLGYQLGWGWWRPNPKNTAPLQNATVKSVKDLQKFLGSLNFYRRHIRNFTFSSAPLTDLLRKNTPWVWTPLHDKCLSELKEKVLKAETLGAPNSKVSILW